MRAAERLKCFVLVEVLEFIPFRDFNADARAPRWTANNSNNHERLCPLQFELIWRAFKLKSIKLTLSIIHEVKTKGFSLTIFGTTHECTPECFRVHSCVCVCSCECVVCLFTLARAHAQPVKVQQEKCIINCNCEESQTRQSCSDCASYRISHTIRTLNIIRNGQTPKDLNMFVTMDNTNAFFSGKRAKILRF